MMKGVAGVHRGMVIALDANYSIKLKEMHGIAKYEIQRFMKLLGFSIVVSTK
jgi:hypothetical protein